MSRPQTLRSAGPSLGLSPASPEGSFSAVLGTPAAPRTQGGLQRPVGTRALGSSPSHSSAPRHLCSSDCRGSPGWGLRAQVPVLGSSPSFKNSTSARLGQPQGPSSPASCLPTLAGARPLSGNEQSRAFRIIGRRHCTLLRVTLLCRASQSPCSQQTPGTVSSISSAPAAQPHAGP